jgi:hypothetical protein
MQIKFLRQAVYLIGAVLMLTSCNQILSSAQTPFSKKILFIGNSYTDINGGLDKQIEMLSPSIGAARISPGGFTLENHWTDGKALQIIRQGGLDYVVLQDQSQTPVVDGNKFYMYAEKFDLEIRKSRARTILFMTWERPDSIRYGVTTANLAASYNSVGAKLGVQVAPVGLAFARSLQERPDLGLYSQDGHPTPYGTFLAACVLYGKIFNASPVGTSYWDWNINSELKAYFQRIAAETLGF